MSSKDFIEIMMNPTRQRIVQYLLLHEKGTPKEMQSELTDIPTASLYRHIKTLYEAGCIEVLEEKKVRGTTEKTYGLVKQPIPEPVTPQDMLSMYERPLMSLLVSFRQYFKQEGADPLKDMLTLSTSTLMLNDEELKELTQQLGEIMSKYVTNKPGNERKQRRFTFITSPCEE